MKYAEFWIWHSDQNLWESSKIFSARRLITELFPIKNVRKTSDDFLQMLLEQLAGSGRLRSSRTAVDIEETVKVKL